MSAAMPLRSSDILRTGSLFRIRGAPIWGLHGFGLLPYEDWTRYGTDAWTLALGAPMRVSFPAIKGRTQAEGASPADVSQSQMRAETSLDERLRARSMLRTKVARDLSTVSPWINGEEARHIIFIGHNGAAEREHVAASSGDDAVRLVVRDCIASAARDGFSQVAIYDHGGLNSRADGIDRARVPGPGSKRTVSSRSLWFGSPACLDLPLTFSKPHWKRSAFPPPQSGAG